MVVSVGLRRTSPATTASTVKPFHSAQLMSVSSIDKHVQNYILLCLFTTTAQQFRTNRSQNVTRCLAAVGDDAGPSVVMTTQLPRLSWRVTTDDDLVIVSFDPSVLRWNQVCATFRWIKQQIGVHNDTYTLPSINANITTRTDWPSLRPNSINKTVEIEAKI